MKKPVKKKMKYTRPCDICGVIISARQHTVYCGFCKDCYKLYVINED